MKFLITLLLFSIASFSARGALSPGDPKIIYVATNGTTSASGRGNPAAPTSVLYDFNGTTRSGAFATATNGDTIIVGPGIYTAPVLPMNVGVTIQGIGLPTFIRTNRISSTNGAFLPNTGAGGTQEYLNSLWLIPNDNCVIDGINFDVSILAPLYASVLCNKNPTNYLATALTAPNDVGASVITFITNGAHFAPTPFAYTQPWTAATNVYSTNVTFRNCRMKGETDIIFPTGSMSRTIPSRYGNTNDPAWTEDDPIHGSPPNWHGMTWYYTTNTMGFVQWTFESCLFISSWDGFYFKGNAADIATKFCRFITQANDINDIPHGMFLQAGAVERDTGSIIVMGTNSFVSPGGNQDPHGIDLADGCFFYANGTQVFVTNGVPFYSASTNVYGWWIDGSNNVAKFGTGQVSIAASGVITSTGGQTFSGTVWTNGMTFAANASNTIVIKDAANNNVTISNGAIVASSPSLFLKGLMGSSNTFPVTANFANLAPSGWAIWDSNGTVYMVATNSLNGNASTNKLGGL